MAHYGPWRVVDRDLPKILFQMDLFLEISHFRPFPKGL